MVMGKNTSSAAIIILENGSSTPNQLLRMGAMAMSGMVLAPMAIGSRTSRAVTQRAVAKRHDDARHGADEQPADGLRERGQGGLLELVRGRCHGPHDGRSAAG